MTKPLPPQPPQACPVCKGTGNEDPYESMSPPCPHCEGTGQEGLTGIHCSARKGTGVTNAEPPYPIPTPETCVNPAHKGLPGHAMSSCQAPSESSGGIRAKAVKVISPIWGDGISQDMVPLEDAEKLEGAIRFLAREEVEERRRRVAELSAQGLRPAEIVKELGVEKSLVANDLLRLRRRGQRADHASAEAERQEMASRGSMTDVIQAVCLGAKAVDMGELNGLVDTLQYLSGEPAINQDARVTIVRLLTRAKAFRAFKEALA